MWSLMSAGRLTRPFSGQTFCFLARICPRRALLPGSIVLVLERPGYAWRILAHPTLVRIKALDQFREHGHKYVPTFLCLPAGVSTASDCLRQYSTGPRDSVLYMSWQFCSPPLFPADADETLVAASSRCASVVNPFLLRTLPPPKLRLVFF